MADASDRGELDRPNNSKNSLSLELVQDEVESGACYLVHIRTALKGQTDANAQSLAILRSSYNRCTSNMTALPAPYETATATDTPTCKKTWPTQTQTVPHLFQT